MAHEINFIKLMQEEKRKAKAQNQRQQQQSNNHEPTPAPATSSSVATNDGDAKTVTPPSWPQDWLAGGMPPLDATEHCVSLDPAFVFYQPTVLTASQQADLIGWLQGLPPATSQGELACWNTLTFAKRRVAMFESPLPDPLASIAAAMVTAGIFEQQQPPNHVLVNEYLPGQGILAHTDGPLYQPRTATISLGGSPVLFKLAKRLTADKIGVQHNRTAVEILLDGGGSLVVFCQDAYTNYVHSIDDQAMEEQTSSKCVNSKAGLRIVRGYRMSLTFRFKLLQNSS
jgi:alkylated DNA repair protein alkB homolog 6